MAKLKVGAVLDCASREEWEAWLAAHHASEGEIWLRLAKKGSAAASVSRADALEVALCYGWIDGQAATQDESYWLQRFTPRSRRSKWSRINRDAAEALIESGMMKPAGLAAVEAARKDGRWEAAYASPRQMTVPPDFEAALQASSAARESFERLNSQNRYAILYRIADAKRPDTRQRRITKFIGMLERGELLH